MCIQKQAIWELFFFISKNHSWASVVYDSIIQLSLIGTRFFSLSQLTELRWHELPITRTHFVVGPFEFNTSIHNIKISYKKKTGSKLIIQSMQIVVVKSSNYINSNNLEWRSCHNTRYMQSPLVTEEIKTHSRHQEEECSINQFNHHPVFVTVLSQCINF